MLKPIIISLSLRVVTDDGYDRGVRMLRVTRDYKISLKID